MDIVVVYESSEEFAPVLSVSLLSLLKNTPPNCEIQIFILTRSMSQVTFQKIENLVSQFPNATVEKLLAPDLSKQFGLTFWDYLGKWTINSFDKLFLSSILPPSIDKVLYLDSDTLICQNIVDLWDTNINDFDFAAAEDPLNDNLMSLLGFSRGDLYFNSGVLLENLKNIRKERVEYKIVDFCRSLDGCVFFSEQTALSFVCQNRIKSLDIKYNVQTMALVTTKKQFLQIRRSWFKTQSDKEVDYSISHPSILHMTSCFLVNNRAWISGSNYPRRDAFDCYAKQVPFFSYCPDLRTKKKKIMDFMLSFLPKCFYFSLVGHYYSSERYKRFKKIAKKSGRRTESL